MHTQKRTRGRSAAIGSRARRSRCRRELPYLPSPSRRDPAAAPVLADGGRDPPPRRADAEPPREPRPDPALPQRRVGSWAVARVDLGAPREDLKGPNDLGNPNHNKAVESHSGSMDTHPQSGTYKQKYLRLL